MKSRKNTAGLTQPKTERSSGQKITPLGTCRCVCAGWKSGLSVFRSDECSSGQGSRCRTDRDDDTAWKRRKGNPASTLVAAHEAGTDEIYKVGGAQAIAALAYGTESIPKADKIAGPGNIYVALAKSAVYGHVSIDSVAGPSEILVLADDSATSALCGG